jgi:hypothetical protein
LGLGITNDNLSKIAIGGSNVPAPAVSQTARYKVEFIARWSASTHPNNYVSNAHFSPFVVYSRNSSPSSDIFQLGGISSGGMEQMAETGATALLNSEIDALISNNNVFKRAQGGVFDSPGSSSTELEFSQDYPNFTFVSMIAPSPDWFVSESHAVFSEGDWLDRVELNVISYDAGTDSGTTLTAPDLDTQPKSGITTLRNEWQGMGTIVLTRIR